VVTALACDGTRIAERLEAANPWWIVIYGAYTGQFVAFPRFSAPKGTVVTALYPGALPQRLRRIERQHAAALPSEPDTIQLRIAS
jgi:hypothetical protein